MHPRHFVLFYVDDATASTRFYERLLGRAPVESSPTFAMFALDESLMLGLWSRVGVQPPAAASSCGSELAFALADGAAVDRTHAQWREQGLAIAQPPTRMDFGYTCVALDPDGHRLRAFAAA